MHPTKKLTVGLNAALSFDRVNNILLLLVMHARLELSVVHQVPASAPVSILQVTVLFIAYSQGKTKRITTKRTN